MGKFGDYLTTPGGAAALSAGGSLLQGVAGGLFGIGSQRRQYKYNLKLQKQQQAWQKYMWDLENQYNLPINELQRLVDAGINPAVAFSNGGAVAAPVPQSGSAGGVSAPMASFPNVAGAAVQSAQAAQALDNQTEVATSQANLNNSLADKAKADAGVANEDKNIKSVVGRLYSENYAFISQIPHLVVGYRKLQNALYGEELSRSQIYTGYFPQELQLKQEHIRLNNRLAEREYDRVGAQIALYQKQGRLTDQQAENLRLMNLTMQADALMGEASARALDILYSSPNGKMENSLAFQDLLASFRQELSNRYASADLKAVELDNQLGFESEFGLASRRILGYNVPLRNMRSIRTQQWTSGVNTFMNVAGTVLGGLRSGASIRHMDVLNEAIQDTGRAAAPSLFSPRYRGGRIY